LVNAAKPLLAQLSAPVLGALLRRRLASLAGLPEAEMATLLPRPTESGTPRPTPSAPRTAPSLIRGLAQCLLLEPNLARRIFVPKPQSGGAEGAALAALVEYCERDGGPLTTAGVMQHFADTPHEATLVAALTGGATDWLGGELLEVQLVEGVKRYWLSARKRGEAAAPTGAPVDLTPEEAERSRQRELARQRVEGGA
jgi:hypothetical protein